MKAAYDLHIHSALSPCADDDMTPNNIVNMSIIKGLDIISVTDHNSSFNLQALYNVSVRNGIMLIPGIEVQTKEEVHMLCYFKNVRNAIEFGNIIYENLPDVENDEQLFGKQLIMDDMDNVIGKACKLLLSSADIPIDNLWDIVKSFKGVCIPAHVDRASYSIISNLGFIPSTLNIKTVEISKYEHFESFIEKFPYLKGLRTITSSDAHYLGDIFERQSFMDIDDFTCTAIFNYIKGK
ncbi:MAG TPA: phosphoesterase [Clostridiaceae bacterium]|nr:phosphoesterase [Clostridiaceae bacterium]